MEYFILAVIFLIAVIAAIRGGKKPPRNTNREQTQRKNEPSFNPKPIQRKSPEETTYSSPYEYGKNGYNSFGYNAFGKNEKGQYNRLYNTKSYEEEGFYSPQLYPIELTDHARERMYERLGINSYQQMRKKTFEAYRHGKSKRQLKKTSARMVEEIEQRYDGKKVLIYENHIYIFTENNVLITVYKNNRIPL